MYYLIFAIVVFAALPLAASAQEKGVSQFCPDQGANKNVFVSVCTHERGMAPLHQPRLFFRVSTSGLAEYEVDGNDGLVTKQTKLSAVETKFIKDVIALPDMAEAKDEYPVYRRFIDSSRETRVSIWTGRVSRTILLRNYTADDYNIAARYPAVLVVLLRTLTDHRERATGVVRELRTLSFYSMITYPDQSIGRDIYVYADYQHRYSLLATGKVVNEHDFLSDHESDTPMEIYMEIDEGTPGIEAMKKTLAEAETARFGGRARLLMRGRYTETVDWRTRNRIRTFHLKEIKDIEPIDLPFKGEIKLGWNYSDTFDRAADDGEITLSSRLKLPNHHAGRIEWTNLREFPQLLKKGRRSIVFRALSQITEPIAPGRWNETFRGTILEAR